MASFEVPKSSSGSRIRERVHYQRGSLAKSVEELRSSRFGTPKEDTEASPFSKIYPDCEESLPIGDPKSLFPSCDDLCMSIKLSSPREDHHNSPVADSSLASARIPKEVDLLSENFLALKKGLMQRFRLSENLGNASPRCCDNCKRVEILTRCKTNLLVHYLCLGCIEKIMGVKTKGDTVNL